MNPNYTSVANRANHCCEYCRAPEIIFNFAFEVEHIRPSYVTKLHIFGFHLAKVAAQFLVNLPRLSNTKKWHPTMKGLWFIKCLRTKLYLEYLEVRKSLTSNRILRNFSIKYFSISPIFSD